MKKAFQNFRPDASCEEFAKLEWVRSYGEFLTLKKYNDMKCWNEWQTLNDYIIGGGMSQRFQMEDEEQTKTFSVPSISNYFQSVNRKVSRETIYNYLEHITSSLIMTKACRYDIRGKRILTKMDKYYLTD